jgi:potassium efflux system protein
MVDVYQRRLLEIVEDYDDFLAEHLLWIRTSNLTRLRDLGTLPEELARLFAPSDWLDVSRVLLYQALHSLLFALVIIVFAILLWKRKWMIDGLRATGERLGKPTTDSFALTAKAVVLTLLAGMPWPLLAFGAGWQLQHSLQGTSFTSTIGLALIAVSAEFYFFQFSRAMCMPSGLAARHFRWPETSLQLLRRELGRLLWAFLPAAFLTHVAINLDPVTLGGMIGRLSFVIISLALGIFFFRVLQPRRGVLVDLVKQARKQPLGWIHQLWFPLLVTIPAILGVLALAGYLYTAVSLIVHLIDTTWMIFGLMVLNGLAVRWLMVTRRKLAYEAALARQKAEREAEQNKESTPDGDASAAIEVEEPEIDLVAMGEESRKLLNATLVFIGIIGLWLIWSEVLPALRFLDQVSLWHYTVTVDGETQRLPITLADIGLAILIGIGSSVLARRLPSVLEIVLLNRFEMTAGGRYTIITLTTYVIVAIGILLFLSTIGVRWSQLQWLVAALGVGIGFGLQEIVANFISGIIILFERPIRVGDIVTVGDTDGVVTRIRIRATTIRNWDRKELLVPNKEFITGRLLNWSLSDQMTRVVIVVGVAYGSDVDRAIELMREAAEEHEHVLDDPRPILSFEGFGDNSLTLILRAYLGSLDYRVATITDLHRAINRKFNEAGIGIAFPQRDIHLDTSSPLKVQVEQEAGPAPAAP